MPPCPDEPPSVQLSLLHFVCQLLVKLNYFFVFLCLFLFHITPHQLRKAERDVSKSIPPPVPLLFSCPLRGRGGWRGRVRRVAFLVSQNDCLRVYERVYESWSALCRKMYALWLVVLLRRRSVLLVKGCCRVFAAPDCGRLAAFLCAHPRVVLFVFLPCFTVVDLASLTAEAVRGVQRSSPEQVPRGVSQGGGFLGARCTLPLQLLMSAKILTLTPCFCFPSVFY